MSSHLRGDLLHWRSVRHSQATSKFFDASDPYADEDVRIIITNCGRLPTNTPSYIWYYRNYNRTPIIDVLGLFAYVLTRIRLI